jgi:16S rRNA (adenine1518-N6/adenine1519-N6)-dimethyltransferase
MRLDMLKNVDYVVCDVLAGKHHIAPDVLGRVRQRQLQTGGLVKLVANLPYGAATPLLAELVMSDAPPERMVFTVQEEVALRLGAARGTRAYGPVGVVVQALAEVELLRPLPPTVFWPQPQVNSSMVRLRPQPALRSRIADLGVFRRTVEGLFAHRRKRSARSLSLADPHSRPTDFWESRLRAAGLEVAARGEMFSVEEIIRLANVVAAEEPKGGT